MNTTIRDLAGNQIRTGLDVTNALSLISTGKGDLKSNDTILLETAITKAMLLVENLKRVRILMVRRQEVSK